jgi:hypothetical protein
MQLSATSVLLTAQQSPGLQRPAAPGPATAVLDSGKGFAPLDFRQAARTAPAAPKPVPDVPIRPGAMIDIRV